MTIYSPSDVITATDLEKSGRINFCPTFERSLPVNAFRYALVLLVFALLALPGCQKKCKRGKDASCWVEALKNPEQVKEAIAELKGLDYRKAEPALVATFKASVDKPKTHEEIAEVFKKWKTKGAVKPMLEALDFSVGPDKDGKRAKATNLANQKIASALGAIGDPQASGHILRLLKATKNAKVKRATIRALGEMKAKEAIDVLLAILEDKSAHKVIRANVIHTLGEIGEPSLVPKLVLALYREKAYFFAHANLALVKIGEPAVDLLVQTMNGKNVDVQRLLSDKVEVLKGALEANAAQVLGDIGSERATEPLLKMVEAVAKWDAANKLIVMVRLINSLGDIRDPKAIKPIMGYMNTEYYDVNIVVASALINIGDRSVSPELLKQAQKGGLHPRVRVPWIEAIGNLGTDEALPTMKEMKAKFKDITVAPAIDKSIKRLEAYAVCKKDVDCWIGKLKDPSAEVREKTAYELGQLGDPKAIDPLIGVIGDPSELTRWGVITAFSRLNSKKPIEAIEKLVNKTEKGSTRFKRVNNKYKRLVAKLKRTGK